MHDQDMSQVPLDLFINGQWRPGSSGQRLDVEDPATGQTVASVASATVEDAMAAVAAAHEAGAAWAATAPRQRAELLRRAFERMSAESERLARLIVIESGKALPEASGEVAYAAEFLRWNAEEAVRAEGLFNTVPGGAHRMLVIRQPVGVCVFVTPWNFPAAMATRKMGPALAAGCTLVLKPASETPLTALALARIFEEVGLPPGVINVVPTRSSSAVVQAMLSDDRVRKLSFTGSTEIGRVLLAQAAQKVINCAMELGGNAPFIVFADADLDAAVAAAMVAKLRNGGESCTAANRFYVERPVAEAFSRKFAQAMAGVRVGPGLEEGVQMGPLVNEATRRKVAALVEDAVARGGRLLTGGRAPEGPGYFYEPTLVADVPLEARVFREEIFGPVAAVTAFDGFDEVIALANATEFGLVAFVHTRDLAKALRAAERIESGMVGINRGVVSDPSAPFGGWKQSGIGREGGHDGLLDYLETKYIALDWR